MNAIGHRLNTTSTKSWMIKLTLVAGLMLAGSAQAVEGIRLNMDEQLGSQNGRSGWDAVGLKESAPEFARLPRGTRLARGDWKADGLNERKVEMARRMFLMALSYR